MSNHSFGSIICGVMVGTIVSGFMSMLLYAGIDYPRLRENDSYESRVVWGPKVTQVDNCKHGESGARCWVTLEGREPIQLYLSKYPGGIILPGDRIGSTYRIGQEVVEVFNSREGQQTMTYRSSCYKKNPDCYYPKD